MPATRNFPWTSSPAIPRAVTWKRSSTVTTLRRRYFSKSLIPRSRESSSLWRRSASEIPRREAPIPSSSWISPSSKSSIRAATSMRSTNKAEEHRMRQAGLILFSFAWVLVSATFTHAASAPQKTVFTFGGLNERSGVLFVARDAGLFRKHGLDATVVDVRNAQGGMSALASGETQFHVGSATGTSIGAMAGGLDLAFIAGLINKLDGTF